ncbi:hypothetical protein NDU88_001667 [Pleurodeles waltl]|uniref:Uncharacterized protein n=1 Tax=Pleurodeles waltl TaxID=8319 RepID=A0AAV7TIW7_PLEWA|nr:hypothetical protein NDU88_001667 [Pleurodeles waltl]
MNKSCTCNTYCHAQKRALRGKCMANGQEHGSKKGCYDDIVGDEDCDEPILCVVDEEDGEESDEDEQLLIFAVIDYDRERRLVTLEVVYHFYQMRLQHEKRLFVHAFICISDLMHFRIVKEKESSITPAKLLPPGPTGLVPFITTWLERLQAAEPRIVCLRVDLSCRQRHGETGAVVCHLELHMFLAEDAISRNAVVKKVDVSLKKAYSGTHLALRAGICGTYLARSLLLDLKALNNVLDGSSDCSGLISLIEH